MNRHLGPWQPRTNRLQYSGYGRLPEPGNAARGERMKRAVSFCFSAVAGLIVAAAANVQAQSAPAAQPAAKPAAASTTAAAPAADNRTPPFKKEELEQILAPIALYPDALLAQIFMASTYPLEIVEAARWSKEHPDVKGDAVAGAVQSQTWDASVKSLV